MLNQMGKNIYNFMLGAQWLSGRVLLGTQKKHHNETRESSGSVVECLKRDRRAAGLSLTGITVLWSLSKTHLS